MTSKLRFLSYHHIPNNGAFLFAYSVLQHWKTGLSPDVKIIDHKTAQLALYGFLKRFRFFRKIPLYYWKRNATWQKEIEDHLSLDRDHPRMSGAGKILDHYSSHADAIAVGMDVWGVIREAERPPFPNIYWLPQKMDIPKIAFAASAYYSDPLLIRQNEAKIGQYLNDFEVIGARDQFTLELVEEHYKRSGGLVEKVPDPTFLYKIKAANIAEKFSNLGIDVDRPILGLLLYGQKELSNKIKDHYHAKGYQIVALSMYNPSADFNLGHFLTPFEWAEAFTLLSFCITDRFHGTLFSLKTQTSFISLQRDEHLPLVQNKNFDLVGQFGMQECFANPHSPDFDPDRFLGHCDELEKEWDKTFKPVIPLLIKKNQTHLVEFTRKIKHRLSL